MSTTPENPIDPKMQSLLDEALSPPTPPAGLADRIVARTSPMLLQDGAYPEPVIVQVGFSRWLAVAAAVLLAGIGAMVVVNIDRVLPTDNNGSLVIDDPAAPEDDIDWSLLEAYAQADENAQDTELDQQIDMLSIQVDFVSVAMSDWSDGQEMLDDALLQYELEQLAGDDLLMF